MKQGSLETVGFHVATVLRQLLRQPLQSWSSFLLCLPFRMFLIMCGRSILIWPRSRVAGLYMNTIFQKVFSFLTHWIYDFEGMRPFLLRFFLETVMSFDL